jgi:uncharacterized membrane protein
MSEHAHPDTASGVRPDEPTGTTSTTTTRWAGWLVFGGVIMVMVGLFNVIVGLVSLVNDRYYVPTSQGLLILDLTGWGWVHFIVGILIALTGGALLSGATWARIVAVLLVGFNALTHLLFISAYPAWSTIVIILDVLVIWAIVAHGNEKEAST